MPRQPKNVSVFSTINRHPGMFGDMSFVDYNDQTTFARVLCGHEHKFVAECKRSGIRFMSYPPHFKF